MKKTWIAGLVLTLMVLFFGPVPVSAEYIINLQGASVLTEKNDIRITGNSGMKFSLSDDLSGPAVDLQDRAAHRC